MGYLLIVPTQLWWLLFIPCDCCQAVPATLKLA